MVMVLINRSSIASNAQATLRELYGLTSAEAATAVAIANGKSAREIAADHDVKEPTIRTHTMHIYAKMNINKLSDLVRIVASLPVLQNRPV